MKRFLITTCLLTLLLSFSGCAALKEQTGEYVTEAITSEVTSRIIAALDERGLSKDEIVAALDNNNDGNLTSAEMIATLRTLAQDVGSAEAKKIVDDKLDEIEHRMLSQDDLDSNSNQMLNWLLLSVGGLVSTYLGKQVLSAKSDSKRDIRIAILEKTLGRDIDGDGKIGNG